MMEHFVKILIYTHAGLGSTALLAGLFALISSKGKSWHRKGGKVFYYAMLSSSVISLVIACLPHHESPFLFSVGIFTLYLIFTGYRALNYRLSVEKLFWDQCISWSMVFTGIGMIAYAGLFSSGLPVVMLVFGILGLLLALQDIHLYGNKIKLQSEWLKLHLGKMIGGYIAAATAFVVVNDIFSGLYDWFVPGILGGFLIAYWMRRISTQQIKTG